MTTAEQNAREYVNNVLEKMQDNPANITYETIDSLKDPARAARENLYAIADEYDKDMANRRAILNSQAAELDKKISIIKRRIETLDDQARTAASCSDLDAAAEADEQAEKLRTALAPMQRKRKIADSAQLKGDPDIYNRVKDAQKRLNRICDICHAATLEALELQRKWTDHFNHLNHQRLSLMNDCKLARYEQERFEKIDQHFLQA